MIRGKEGNTERMRRHMTKHLLTENEHMSKIIIRRICDKKLMSEEVTSKKQMSDNNNV